MKNARLTASDLDSLLADLVTGAAEYVIQDAMEIAYPVSYDPSTGQLMLSEDN